MTILNTRQQFGSLAKLLHWSIFILVIIQYALVYTQEYLPEHSPEKLQYILLHKSFGLIVLILAFVMLLNRQLGQRPSYPETASWYENMLAKIVHFLLYTCLLLMPTTGILMTILSGRTLAIFGTPLPTPRFIDINKPFAEFFYNAHVYTSYILLFLVGLHLIGALYHHFILKDTVLSRMWINKKDEESEL